MNVKTCSTCGRTLPDTPVYFYRRLAKGGIWSTTKKCRSCMNARARELKIIREVKKLLEVA